MKKRWILLSAVFLLALFFGSAPARAENAEYPVKIMGESVTDANKDDLLGDGGSMKYVPAANGNPARIVMTNVNRTINPGEAKEYLETREPLDFYMTGTNAFTFEKAKDSFTAFFGYWWVDEERQEVPMRFFGGTLNITMKGTEERYIGAISAESMTIRGAKINIVGEETPVQSNFVQGDVYLESGSLSIKAATTPHGVNTYGIYGNLYMTGGSFYCEANKGVITPHETIELGESIGGEGSDEYDGSNPEVYNPERARKYRTLRLWEGGPLPMYSYPVWVGGTQVTSENAHDVLGDQTVSYAPAEGGEPAVLTLSGADIQAAPVDGEGAGARGILAHEPLDIRLEGKSAIRASLPNTENYGILVGENKNCPLRLLGSGSLSVDIITTTEKTGYGIRASKITLDGPSVHVALSDDSSGALRRNVGINAPTDGFTMKDGNLTVKGAKDTWGIQGGFYFEGGDALIQGGKYAAYEVETASGCAILADRRFEGPGSEFVDPGQLTNYKYLRIGPREHFFYPVWVGGVQVTALNQNDVLGDGGSVKYEDSHVLPKLTLKKANIEGAERDGVISAIRVKQDINISLIGKSKIEIIGANNDVVAINGEMNGENYESTADIAFTGAGSLEMELGDNGYAQYKGILGGSVALEGATLKISADGYGDTCGIETTSGKTLITGGNLSVRVGEHSSTDDTFYAIAGPLRVMGGTVELYSGDIAIRGLIQLEDGIHAVRGMRYDGADATPFNPGVMTNDFKYFRCFSTGLRRDSVGTHYFDENGNMAKSCWMPLEGNTFYFDENGNAATGLTWIGSQLYYFNKATCYQVKDRWVTEGNDTYYFNPHGPAYKGLRKIGKFWYYFDPVTAEQLKKSWKTVNGKTYYFNQYGPAYTGLRQIGKFYYGFSPDGVQYKDGWFKIGAKQYYFNKYGVMRASR